MVSKLESNTKYEVLQALYKVVVSLPLIYPHTTTLLFLTPSSQFLLPLHTLPTRTRLGDIWGPSSSSSQLLCRAAFNAAYSHTRGLARELVRS